MAKTDDDPPEFPDEISTSSNKAKHDCCYSNEQYCRLIRLIPTFQLLEELLYEVCLRLPVKSLIRFRCVSKGMRRLIDSPIFMKNHNIHRSLIIERERDRSEEDDYAIVLCQPTPHRLFSLDFEKDDDNNLNRAKAIELNSTFAQEGRMEFMGRSCNGIFCFKNFQSKCYVFWNPSNGTFRKVDSSSCRFSLNASMGYDCVNDDYKIIRFILNEAILEVYSLRNDSWRKIPDFPLSSCSFTGAVCLGGVMHWLRTNRTDVYMYIAAFDLATETFTSLHLPLEARRRQLQPYQFTDFRGRLCVTFLPPSYPSDYPQTIWVMEKYGVESSWTKLHDFRNTARCIPNFYFPSMKRRLLCNYRGLSWWDPQYGSFQNIEIPGLLNDRARCRELCSSEAYIYVRNLVRLDQTFV